MLAAGGKSWNQTSRENSVAVRSDRELTALVAVAPLLRIAYDPLFPGTPFMIRPRAVLATGFNWCGIYRVHATFCRLPSTLSF
jgi:hypothetical protein